MKNIKAVIVCEECPPNVTLTFGHCQYIKREDNSNEMCW